MPAADFNEQFQNDKIFFFGKYHAQKVSSDPISESKDQINTISKLTNEINNLAEAQSYLYLHHNRKSLEQEFSDLLAALKKGKDDKPVFWLYSLYCCILLENYYRSYRQPTKAKQFETQKQEILQKLTLIKNDEKANAGFAARLVNQLKDGFSDLLTLPLHPSKLRDQVGIANFWRIYWVFCRLMVETGLRAADAIQLFDKLDDLLGQHIDVDKIIHQFEAPTFAVNLLSVGIFAARFMINLSFLIKHVFFPSKQEETIPTFERFKLEWSKRNVDMFNHGVWAFANFITNFNKMLHISGPLAAWLLPPFITVDLFCLYYLRCSAKDAYIEKRDSYESQITYYLDLITENSSAADIAFSKEQIDMLRRQLDELEIQWKTKDSVLIGLSIATVFLMSGFTLSLLVTLPVAIMAAYFVCMASAAFFLSEKSFTEMMHASFELDIGRCRGLHEQALVDAFQNARSEFVFNMVKNAIIPSFLIASYAICWPAALGFTVLYVGYELHRSHQKHNKALKKEVDDIIKPEKAEEDVVSGFEESFSSFGLNAT